MPFSRGFSQPGNWTQVSCIAGSFLIDWTVDYKLFLSIGCVLWATPFFQTLLSQMDAQKSQSWRVLQINRANYIDDESSLPTSSQRDNWD